MAIGAYIFSYHVFSLFFPGQNPPFLLPVGMAAGLLLLAIPTLAGLGLRLLIDGFVRRKPILAADLFDLLAVMQYVAIGFVLIVGYLAIK